MRIGLVAATLPQLPGPVTRRVVPVCARSWQVAIAAAAGWHNILHRSALSWPMASRSTMERIDARRTRNLASVVAKTGPVRPRPPIAGIVVFARMPLTETTDTRHFADQRVENPAV